MHLKALRNSLLVVLLITILTGCASSEFMYNRINWLTRYQIEKYVDLNKDQDQLVKTNMDAMMDWHRQSELTKYINFLDNITSALDGEIKAEDIKHWLDEVQLAYDSIRITMAPWLVELANDLSPEQVEEIRVSMREQNAELEKEYLSRDKDEYIESLNKRLNRSLKYWLGPLNSDQKMRIELTAVSMERLDSEWLQGRKRWQQQVSTALDKETNWENELAILIKDGRQYTEQAEEQTSDRNIQRISVLVADVLNTRTDKQDRKLRKTIGKWRKDIASLRDKGEPTKKVALY